MGINKNFVLSIGHNIKPTQIKVLLKKYIL